MTKLIWWKKEKTKLRNWQEIKKWQITKFNPIELMTLENGINKELTRNEIIDEKIFTKFN